MKPSLFLLPAIPVATVLGFIIVSSQEIKCKPTEVAVGMTEEELLKLCGKPKRRNYSSKGEVQWVYDGGSGLFVYINEGRIQSVQWSE